MNHLKKQNKFTSKQGYILILIELFLLNYHSNKNSETINGKKTVIKYETPGYMI